MLDRVFKSEYVYRPAQVFHRFFRQSPVAADGYSTVRLPWGISFRINSRDDMGRQIRTLGVYDLVLTETLWRLADPGELAIDAGGNIGYATAVLAGRTGPSGSVITFEPHPLLFEELSYNCERVTEQIPGCRITLRQVALGATTGTLNLHVPADFQSNRGIASVVEPTGAGSTDRAGETVVVQSTTLDDETRADATVGVMKIDVEGYEASVLAGAGRLLSERRLRDCVFEEHRAYPSDVTDLFERNGYTVFRLGRSLRRPVLLPPDSTEPRSTWEATNFLATLDAERAKSRFSHSGWDCLSAV